MNAQQAMYEVLFNHLNGESVWGNQVEPLTLASSALVKPYLVYFLAGGGREVSVPVRDHARLTISVKCVGLTMAEVMTAQDAMSGLLHNSGVQDVNPQLPTHPEWHVLTVTEGRIIWLEEKFEGQQSIYHGGYQYEFLMERK